ncbi:DUF4492 domain-containing protein [Bacteroides sedimenti]|uniref:DUF4492 domain-containing protein n=1 Tax=Bacteroides sedimenti TaxID=2136147 RepID=A0ABM8ICF8_9BACE
MTKKNIIVTIYSFYIEGFRAMKLGKVLWMIILIKLFILFFILKLFFFPRFLNNYKTDEAKQEYVGSELVNRAKSNNQ